MSSKTRDWYSSRTIYTRALQVNASISDLITNVAALVAFPFTQETFTTRQKRQLLMLQTSCKQQSMNIICSDKYSVRFLTLKSNHVKYPPTHTQTTSSTKTLLLKNPVPQVGKGLICFVFPWWPRCTAHETMMKALKGRRDTRIVHVLHVSSVVALVEKWHDLTSTLQTVAFPIISGLLETGRDWACSHGDDTRNDKTPMSVCRAPSLSDWHLLAQAHLGSGETRDKRQTQMAFSLAILSSTSFRREKNIVSKSSSCFRRSSEV